MKAYISTAARCPLETEWLHRLGAADEAGELAFEDRVEVVKSEPHSYSGALSVGPDTLPVFVKCYKPAGILGKALAGSGATRPFRVYRAASSIADEFFIPTPLALVRNRKSLNVYYFSQYLAGQNLAEFVRIHNQDVTILRQVMSSVASALASFHKQGWMHGDFKWTNVVIADDGAGSARQIYFVDLDAVASLSALRSDRGRDLARFMVNAEDNGGDPFLTRCFIEVYAEAMSEPIARVLAVADPSLQKLRRRHRLKYGQPGER